MDVDVLRIALCPEFTPRILVGAHQFFLLRVHRDDGLVHGELAPDRLTDVLKLRIPVRMLRALEALAVRLQAVPQFLQQPRHHLHARGVSLLRERGDEVALTPRGPQQRRLRIAARRRLDERLQIAEQRRIFLRRLLPPGPWSPTAGGRQGRRCPALQRSHLSDPTADHARSHAGRARRHGDTTVADGHRLTGDE